MARNRRGTIGPLMVDYLRSNPTGARLSELKRHVEMKLGHTVPPTSIRSYLIKHTGDTVERVSPGYYRAL
jgi:hypothetical protein